MQLATTFRSIVEANPSRQPIDFHVLSGGVTPNSQSKVFNSLPKGFGSIRWVDVDLGLFKSFSTLPHISNTTYARFLIPRIFSAAVSRVLYLDADLLVMDALGPLLETDLEGKVVGAVLDGLLDSALKSGASGCEGVPLVRDYFNAGVLLIDLNQWREKQISERALEYLARHPQSPYSDQDALNVACDKLWKKLDHSWNFQGHIHTRVSDLLQGQRPGIVHFVTSSKPWVASVRSLNARLYDSFRSRTLFARTPLDKLLDTLRRRAVLRAIWRRCIGRNTRYPNRLPAAEVGSQPDDSSGLQCPNAESNPRITGVTGNDPRGELQPHGPWTNRMSASASDRNSPLVTFVVPCYEMADLLPECLRSLLQQTFCDFEILVMDNCSLDNTPEVVHSFRDDRMRYIRNERNLGHVRNFVKGVTLARGKYVWVIAADDLLRSRQVLGRYVELMERSSGVGYVFCRAIEVRNGKEAGVVEWADCGDKDHVWDGAAFLGHLIRRNCIVMSSCMAKKECYDKVGTFPLDMPYACDWYVWSTFATNYRVAYFAEPMVCFRVHDRSLTTLSNVEDPRFCLADELRAVCRVVDQAKRCNVSSVVKVGDEWIARRAARALYVDQVEHVGHGPAKDHLGAVFYLDVKHPGADPSLWARIQRALGDEYYYQGNREVAGRMYWRGLRLRPWWPKSLGKCLLLEMGGVGAWIRGLWVRIAPTIGLKKETGGLR